MKRTEMATIGIGVLLVSLCALSTLPAQAESAERFREISLSVDGFKYHGAIVPADFARKHLDALQLGKADDYWTPSELEIASAELSLRHWLEAASGGSSGEAHHPEIDRIRANLARYRRQYVGILIDGQREVFINFFPEAENGTDNHAYWLDEFVVVFDGGFWFWRIQCGIESSSCHDFLVNGDA
jgi:hypothetical protein